MAKAKNSKDRSANMQLALLLLVLAALIVISAVGTLMAVGVIQTDSSKAQPVGSISAAEGICNQQVKADYKDNLNAMTVDDHSSRYDTATGQYKMFYELDVYDGGNKTSGVKTFYVNCFVSAKNGSIARIDYLEQLDFKPKAIRRTKGNAFGF